MIRPAHKQIAPDDRGRSIDRVVQIVARHNAQAIARFDDRHPSAARCEIDVSVGGDGRGKIAAIRIQSFLLEQNLSGLLLVTRYPSAVLHDVTEPAPNVARYQETGKCNLRLPDAPGN